MCCVCVCVCVCVGTRYRQLLQAFVDASLIAKLKDLAQKSMVARRQLVAPTAQKSPTRLPRSVVPSPLSPGASPPAARPGNANTSTWNAKGTTYEEKDVTAWMKDKLKSLLVGMRVDD